MSAFAAGVKMSAILRPYSGWKNADKNKKRIITAAAACTVAMGVAFGGYLYYGMYYAPVGIPPTRVHIIYSEKTENVQPVCSL